MRIAERAFLAMLSKKCLYGFNPGAIIGLLADEYPVLETPDMNGLTPLVEMRKKVEAENKRAKPVRS